MRIQRTAQTTLQAAPAKPPADKPTEAKPTFDTDRFVSSQRNPQGDIGGGGGYGTSGFSSGSRSRGTPAPPP